MEKIDLDLLEKIFSSDKNKLISTGFIAGMLSDEIYKDNQLFFYLYNKLQTNHKEKLLNYLNTNTIKKSVE